MEKGASMKRLSRAARNVRWIERYCVVPDGPTKGQPARLSDAEVLQIHNLYDAHPDQDIAVSGRLAAFVCLLHLVGPEAVRGQDFHGPPVGIWVLMRSASAELQQYLKTTGRRLSCVELGSLSWRQPDMPRSCMSFERRRLPRRPPPVLRTPKPLALTASQLQLVTTASAGLLPTARTKFMEALADTLLAEPEISDGRRAALHCLSLGDVLARCAGPGGALAQLAC